MAPVCQARTWSLRFSEFNTARRSRNQTQLQRLKPIERNFALAGLKPGPPKGPENSARGAKKFRISSTEDWAQPASTRSGSMPSLDGAFGVSSPRRLGIPLKTFKEL